MTAILPNGVTQAHYWQVLGPVPEDVLKLAPVAAVFVGAGLSDREAFIRAASLVRAGADLFLDVEAESLRSSPQRNLSLDGALRRLGVKRTSTLKGYLTSCLPETEAAALWSAGAAGEAVFTPTLIQSLLAEQQAVRLVRQQKAQEARMRRRREDFSRNRAAKARFRRRAARSGVDLREKSKAPQSICCDLDTASPHAVGTAV